MINEGLITKGFGGLNFINDGTKTTILGIAGDYLRIGDAWTTNHSLNSEDDLEVTGKLEVDGQTYFDATVNFSGGQVNANVPLIMGDDIYFGLGGAPDSRMYYETADADAKCINWMVDESDDSGNNVPAWVFSEETNLINADLGLLDEVVEPHLVTLTNSGQLSSATDGVADEGTASAILKKTGGFTNGAVGDIVRMTGGTNVTVAWYWITTRTSADQVTLDRNYTSGDTTNVAFQTWSKVAMLTPKAIYLPIYDGAPQDSDIDIDMAGAMALDVGQSNGRLYWRIGAAWHYVDATAGLSMPKEERIDPSGNKFEMGDMVELRIDKINEDGSFHAMPYRRN